MRTNLRHLLFDEDILIKKLQKGDKEAYQFLFDTYYNILCLYTTSLTKCHTISEDIVQNVFMNLWAKREALAIHTSLKSYLFKATYNIFINDYRKQQRQATQLDKLYYEALQKSIVEEEHYIAKRLEWINREIEILPPKSKKIFEMNKKRGLSYKEISYMLGVSENTVESHIGRALKRIRNRIPEPLLFMLYGSKSKNSK